MSVVGGKLSGRRNWLGTEIGVAEGHYR